MKNQESIKLIETITFRTTAERKSKLKQQAEEIGKSLGRYCEDIISNFDVSTPSAEVQQNKPSRKQYDLLAKLVGENSDLREQIKILTDQLKSTEENKESIIHKISNVIPAEEREKFIARFKKMFEYRIKSGKDKSEEETIYRCIIYCLQWGAFFVSGD